MPSTPEQNRKFTAFLESKGFPPNCELCQANDFGVDILGVALQDQEGNFNMAKLGFISCKRCGLGKWFSLKPMGLE